MQPHPVVSIVGRPNVGKSSLFNRILRQKVAVVDDVPGVTRDRNYRDTSWNGFRFTLVDTGGLIPASRESIASAIRTQVASAVAESAVVLFLVDAQTGPTDVDLLIARQLKKSCADRLILTANKAESKYADAELPRLLPLGCGEPVAISALHGKGIGDLLDRICSLITRVRRPSTHAPDDIAINIAITGRPNSGKSSLVNKLLKSDRMIVDDAPGTTRDAIDSIMTFGNRKIRLIDTAGLRKKTRVHDNTEYYCNLRALESIPRCDVCVLLIDTANHLGEQDMKILSHTIGHRKGMILCWNKWDIVEKDAKTFDRLTAQTKKTYRELRAIPMISISARTGQRVSSVIDTALEVKERMTTRIKPSQLRSDFTAWVTTHPHPYRAAKEIRFLGIKQLTGDYPHFTVFCSNPAYVSPSYNRFLANKIQETYKLSGCPVVLAFKTAGAKKRERKNERSR